MLSIWLPPCRRAWRKRSRGNAALPDVDQIRRHLSRPPPSTLRTRSTWMAASGSSFLAFSTARILRRLDGKRLFHAAAEDRIAVLVLFDKKVFVVIAHKMLLVC